MKNLVIGRRAFLRGGTLVLGAGMLGGASALNLLAEEKARPVLKIGLVTDVHYADLGPRMDRFYRQSTTKLRESIDHFNKIQADFIVELGDLIDAADSVQGEIRHLQTIEAEFARFKGDRFYVLGNHCVWTLTKAEFLDHSGAKETVYSFDRGPFHFIVLDACYRTDGQPYGRKNCAWTDTDIPPAQRDWLRMDLRKTTKPVVVFVHQRLDLENKYAVKSAPLVREILEKSSHVLAVFQGHSHKNDYRQIGGIHYCTLRAVVEGSGEENNGYSVLSVYPNGSMRVEGFRRQKDYRWAGGAA
jgi:alkaline phosphatase